MDIDLKNNKKNNYARADFFVRIKNWINVYVKMTESD